MDTQNSSTSSSERGAPDTAWRRFFRVFGGTLLVLSLLAYPFVLLIDPYDSVSFSPDFERMQVDGTQRLFYPALARKPEFDSAIIGSSNVRLLNPAQLDGVLEGRFANLAMNAASSWEQEQIFNVFRRHHPDARNIIVGLDYVWCLDRYSEERFIGANTAADFPGWLYDEDTENNWPPLNLGTLKHALRQMAFALGLWEPKYRRDGYTVFTDPMDEYDLRKARINIFGSEQPRNKEAVDPPLEWSAQRRSRIPIRALDRLERMLASLPAQTRKILVFVPYHYYYHPTPGSREAIVWDECKQRVAGMGSSIENLYVVDFMIRSDITTEDSNYWDHKHYTVDVAEQLGEMIGEAVSGSGDQSDYRVLEAREE